MHGINVLPTEVSAPEGFHFIAIPLVDFLSKLTLKDKFSLCGRFLHGN